MAVKRGGKDVYMTWQKFQIKDLKTRTKPNTATMFLLFFFFFKEVIYF